MQPRDYKAWNPGTHDYLEESISEDFARRRQAVKQERTEERVAERREQGIEPRVRYEDPQEMDRLADIIIHGKRDIGRVHDTKSLEGAQRLPRRWPKRDMKHTGRI